MRWLFVAAAVAVLLGTGSVLAAVARGGSSTSTSGRVHTSTPPAWFAEWERAAESTRSARGLEAIDTALPGMATRLAAKRAMTATAAVTPAPPRQVAPGLAPPPRYPEPYSPPPPPPRYTAPTPSPRCAVLFNHRYVYSPNLNCD